MKMSVELALQRAQERPAAAWTSWLGGIVWLAALVVAGCGQGVQPEAPRKLVITGSSTVAPLIAEIAKQFEAQHPGVRIDVQTGGSSRGVADVRKGLADIGMVSRDAGANEADLHWFALARDGVAMIVHRDNPVNALTDAQVQAIYRDEVNNWQQVGGKDAPIVVVNKAAGRSTLELFLQHFGLKDREVVADVVIGDNQQGIKTVAASRDAIGYVSIGSGVVAVEQGTPIRLLAAGEVEAALANVKNGTFPLIRTLHLVTAQPPEGVVRDFIQYCQSPAVHGLIGVQGFVPLAG